MSLSVKTRLILLGCLGGFMALVAGAAGWWGVSQQSDGFANVVVMNTALRNQMQADMMHDALRGDAFAALLAKTPAEHQEVQKALAEHSQEFRECIDANKAAALSEPIARAVEAISPTLDAYIRQAEVIVASASTDTAKAEAELPQFAAAFERLEGEMEQLGDLIQQSTTDAQAQSVRTQQTAQWKIIGAVVAAFVALLTTAMVIIRSILTPLKNTMDVLARAADGDLLPRVATSGTDEFARLGESCNVMLNNTTKIVKSVLSSSTVVATSAEEITRAGAHSAEGLRAQTHHVDDLLASMKEMSDSISDVAQRCAGAAQAAQDSELAAAQGGESIGGTIDDMAGIKDSVAKGADIVAGLGKRSEEIGRIIGVINDIADQTNLLALNAAIEAARAGEHGRGFAVVADEVRKLADRTTAATGEVAQSIRTIQDETGHAVNQISDGVKRVTDGSTRASKAGEELSKIVGSVHQVADMIRTIAAAAEEQSAAAAKIADTMGTVKQATEQVAAQADQTQTAATTLSERSREVASMVGKFKV